jgi:chromosome segregation ATPase
MTEMRDPSQRSALFPDEGAGGKDLHGRVHYLESTLAQRQEEIAQLRAELERKQHADDPAPATEDSQATITRLKFKLADADAWVFKLAQDRRDLEVQNASLDRKLKVANRLYEHASAELNSASTKYRKSSDTIKRLSAEKDAAEKAIRSRVIEIDTLNEAAMEASRAHVSEIEKFHEAAMEASRAHVSEIEKFHELIRYKDNALAQIEYREEWLRRVLSVLTRSYSRSFKNWLRSLLPAFLSVRRQRKSLKRAGLFDNENYLSLHSDVARTRTDPLLHYVHHGIREGRAIGD